MKAFTAGLLLLLCAAFPAQSMDIRAYESDSIRWIEATGEINEGDALKLDQVIQSNPDYRTLVFISGGGDLLSGIELGQVARRHQMETYIPNDQECLSACFFAFIGGQSRSVSETGRLGVHQFYGGENNRSATVAQSETQFASAEVLNYVLMMGVSVGAFEMALRTPPEQMHIFSREELERFRIEGDAPIVVDGPRRNDKCPFPQGYRPKNDLGLYPDC